MAARHLPVDRDFVPSQTITIGTNFEPSPKGCTIAPPGTLSITFTNNSGTTIDIQFETNPVYPNQIVFNNVSNLANGTSNTQQPQVANATVNYNVIAGGTPYGPYAIQVGNGPMYVQITYDTTKSAGQCTPDPIAIPPGGTLEMVSTDYTYTVGWLTSDPFTPALNWVYDGVANNTPHTANNSLGDYSYTVAKYPKIQNSGSGGGTVKVKGT
jgi:hypothetical protein